MKKEFNANFAAAIAERDVREVFLLGANVPELGIPAYLALRLWGESEQATAIFQGLGLSLSEEDYLRSEYLSDMLLA